MFKNVAIIGCGDISSVYLKNLRENVNVAACCDIVLDKAEKRANEFGIKKALTPQQLWESDEIDAVINLTIPSVHYDVSIAALKSNKHVYSEKPIAINTLQSQAIIDLATQKKMSVGIAPDTFLGGAHQAAKKLVDSGVIGKPIAVNSFMMASPPENWHPDPGFLYKRGAGPLFDMGPYYLTSMVNLLGSITKVSASGSCPYPVRKIKSEPKFGEEINVEVPTYVVGTFEFENGTVGTLTTTFDICASRLPHIEIYGTEGTIALPDPNYFGGEVWCYTNNKKQWDLIPPENEFVDNNRGIGFLEMVDAVRRDSVPIANGQIAHHVLEVMQGCIESIKTGNSVLITSRSPKQRLFLGL